LIILDVPGTSEALIEGGAVGRVLSPRGVAVPVAVGLVTQERPSSPHPLSVQRPLVVLQGIYIWDGLGLLCAQGLARFDPVVRYPLPNITYEVTTLGYICTAWYISEHYSTYHVI
jgi:hypothetical protein